MLEAVVPYFGSVLALGFLGFLVLVQLLVADLIAIRRGHVPGTPVSASHGDLLFRATRAHANTSESIGAVILISAFAIVVGGDPAWVNPSLAAFLAFRLIHMLAYYLDLRVVRGVAFALGFGALCVVFVVGLKAMAAASKGQVLS